MDNSLINKIKKYINKNKDNVLTLSKFNNNEFESYSYESIKRTINQLVQEGYVKQVMTGLYYKPIYVKEIDQYTSPSPEQIAISLAQKMKWTISITGERALNLLGLSTQTTNTLTYVSTGPYKQYFVNKSKIIFKRCKANELIGLSDDTKILIQAIKTLGKENISNSIISKLQKRFDNKTKRLILSESRNVTLWINKVIKEICIAV